MWFTFSLQSGVAGCAQTGEVVLKQEFEAKGIHVASVTYDSWAILKIFADRKGIAYEVTLGKANVSRLNNERKAALSRLSGRRCQVDDAFQAYAWKPQSVATV